MLSYRHACHAGNFADVLKHQCACLLLSRLAAKDKPLTVIETHAGAGVYDLTAPLARRTREASSGIARALLDQRLQLYVPEYYEALRKLQFDAGAAAALSGARDARRAGSVSEDAPRPVSAVSAAVSPAVSPAVSAVNVNHVNHEDHVKHEIGRAHV